MTLTGLAQAMLHKIAAPVFQTSTKLKRSLQTETAAERPQPVSQPEAEERAAEQDSDDIKVTAPAVTGRVESQKQNRSETESPQQSAHRQIATPGETEIRVESVTGGVVRSVGNGIKNIAGSGRYFVLGVRYGAEDLKNLFSRS